MQIVPAQDPAQMQTARELFQEYADQLGVSLCFQGFARELADLPGAYAPPRGRLLLALADAQPVGCVALRPISDSTCEMKRLFVRPAYRGTGLGRRLALRVIEEARLVGYQSMRLDTLQVLVPALKLYESLGFRPIPPYYETPLGETVFLELKL
jgi:GNAT superfamily N-acetyltransferase